MVLEAGRFKQAKNSDKALGCLHLSVWCIFLVHNHGCNFGTFRNLHVGLRCIILSLLSLPSP